MGWSPALGAARYALLNGSQISKPTSPETSTRGYVLRLRAWLARSRRLSRMRPWPTYRSSWWALPSTARRWLWRVWSDVDTDRYSIGHARSEGHHHQRSRHASNSRGARIVHAPRRHRPAAEDCQRSTFHVETKHLDAAEADRPSRSSSAMLRSRRTFVSSAAYPSSPSSPRRNTRARSGSRLRRSSGRCIRHRR